uniref:Ig-like domain-containing protein n=1 Tax=Malurus cyaneus samueli TaxID=2593467 RepID=A0A8C5U4J8_9PASS
RCRGAGRAWGCSRAWAVSATLHGELGERRLGEQEPESQPKYSPLLAHTRPAAPCFVRKLKNAAIGTGCDIRLRVVVAGNPRPSLRWYRNEEQLAQGGEEYGTLWIRDSKKEDAGVYTCIAENEQGEAMTSHAVPVLGNPFVKQIFPDRGWMPPPLATEELSVGEHGGGWHCSEISAVLPAWGQ